MTVISISPGNIKLGTIPSISLPPEKVCGDRLCKRLCYARRMEVYRPTVRRAWEKNWEVLQEGTYMSQVYVWLSHFKPSYFRWHVGGDIPNQEYLNDMIYIAHTFSDTKFLAFTKNYNLQFAASMAQDNLSILISMWPGIEAPKGAIVNLLPKAWMYDENNKDDRLPKDAYECGGNCITCNECWHLKYRTPPHVVFHKH